MNSKVPAVLLALNPAEQEQIVAKTAAQIIKDTGISDALIPDQGVPQLLAIQWQNELGRFLQEVMVHQKQQFRQILYKTDLLEKDIIRKTGNAENAPDVIAGMIIYRAFQKVMTRRHFSRG